MLRFSLLVFIISILDLSSLNAQQWRYLFDGVSLEGWEQHGGSALYEVSDSILIGTAVNSPTNSFLCTKEVFDDFIIEMEVKLPDDLNTGIMFRSDIRPEKDRVFGYQFEIDPSYRRFSGGIYDEARRLWMYPISRNPKAYDAFRLGHWNTLRIECFGHELRTYINGQMCANMIDDEAAKGIFGLQVHGIYKPQDIGNQVMWRNIKILTDDVEAYRLPIDPSTPELNYLTNTLTAREKRQGIRLLELIEKSSVENCSFVDGIYNCSFDGILEYDAALSNFELSFEFKIDKEADAGVFYRLAAIDLPMQYQLIDDATTLDAKLGVNGNRGIASLYDLIPADNLTTPGRGKQYKGTDLWNHGRIVVKDGVVEHWLNHEKAVAYDVNSQAFKALLAHSEDREKLSSKSAIQFVTQRGKVAFKNVKIREF